MIRGICLYLHIHQPYRFRKYTIFDCGKPISYWDAPNYRDKQCNERIFKRVAEKSYRPTLDLLEKLIKKYPKFFISFSITGTWLEQAEKWAPDLIEKINSLIKTGHVEILSETYYHSLSFFYSKEEFASQVTLHRAKIKDLFGVKPKVFRNTELAYNDSLAKWAEKEGYVGILAEGWDKILEWRSPNYIYSPKNCKNIKLLLKNYKKSDDIAFRFSDQTWSDWPLTPKKFVSSLKNEKGNLLNLFMDFETFGEHQPKSSGIFDFLSDFVKIWLEKDEHTFLTASEACIFEPSIAELSMKNTVTWADSERDLSAWTGNELQKEAEKTLYSLRSRIMKTGDKCLIEDFRRLTTSDHPYYMCTKYWRDGDVHAYFSAYDSPYDAFIFFMNIIRDLTFRLEILEKSQKHKTA